MSAGESDTFVCPTCGAKVSTKAKACPECGSDEKTGWSENTIYDGTDIEDPDEFDYEDWKRREVDRADRKSGMRWLWSIVTVIVVVMVIWLLIR